MLFCGDWLERVLLKMTWFDLSSSLNLLLLFIRFIIVLFGSLDELIFGVLVLEKVLHPYRHWPLAGYSSSGSRCQWCNWQVPTYIVPWPWVKAPYQTRLDTRKNTFVCFDSLFNNDSSGPVILIYTSSGNFTCCEIKDSFANNM